MVNWSNRKDRRNVRLNAIADLDSGYVFGMHLNFDGSLAPDEVKACAIALEKARATEELTGEISAEYASAAMERDDVEDSDEKDKDTALPTFGLARGSCQTRRGFFMARESSSTGVGAETNFEGS